MKITLFATILLLATVPICTPAQGQSHQHELGDDPNLRGARVVERPARQAVSRNRGADKVLRDSGWELRITYRRKGTRSEGQDGVLLHDDKIVEGKSEGEVVMTPFGEMKYYGMQKTKNGWNITGWNFAEEGKIKRWGEDHK